MSNQGIFGPGQPARHLLCANPASMHGVQSSAAANTALPALPGACVLCVLCMAQVDQCVCSCPTELPPFARGVSTQECMCKPGYGSPTGEGPCHVCPVGTYSEGRTLEECKICPFSTTSVAGATSKADCLPVAQKCPVGQVAPPHAFSPDQCGCLPGYGGE